MITEAEARRLGILPESNTRKVRHFDLTHSDYILMILFLTYNRNIKTQAIIPVNNSIQTYETADFTKQVCSPEANKNTLNMS